MGTEPAVPARPIIFTKLRLDTVIVNSIVFEGC